MFLIYLSAILLLVEIPLDVAKSCHDVRQIAVVGGKGVEGEKTMSFFGIQIFTERLGSSFKLDLFP